MPQGYLDHRILRSFEEVAPFDLFRVIGTDPDDDHVAIDDDLDLEEELDFEL